jgi:hypothetical protein
LPAPGYIKMDVDGIEHIILRGATAVLTCVRGLQVEINDDFEAQSRESHRILEAAGLRLVRKTHSELIADNAAFGRTFNQLWIR